MDQRIDALGLVQAAGTSSQSRYRRRSLPNRVALQEAKLLGHVRRGLCRRGSGRLTFASSACLLVPVQHVALGHRWDHNDRALAGKKRGADRAPPRRVAIAGSVQRPAAVLAIVSAVKIGVRASDPRQLAHELTEVDLEGGRPATRSVYIGVQITPAQLFRFLSTYRLLPARGATVWERRRADLAFHLRSAGHRLDHRRHDPAILIGAAKGDLSGARVRFALENWKFRLLAVNFWVSRGVRPPDGQNQRYSSRLRLTSCGFLLGAWGETARYSLRSTIRIGDLVDVPADADVPALVAVEVRVHATHSGYRPWLGARKREPTSKEPPVSSLSAFRVRTGTFHAWSGRSDETESGSSCRLGMWLLAGEESADARDRCRARRMVVRRPSQSRWPVDDRPARHSNTLRRSHPRPVAGHRGSQRPVSQERLCGCWFPMGLHWSGNPVDAREGGVPHRGMNNRVVRRRCAGGSHSEAEGLSASRPRPSRVLGHIETSLPAVPLCR